MNTTEQVEAVTDLLDQIESIMEEWALETETWAELAPFGHPDWIEHFETVAAEQGWMAPSPIEI